MDNMTKKAKKNLRLQIVCLTREPSWQFDKQKVAQVTRLRKKLEYQDDLRMMKDKRFGVLVQYATGRERYYNNISVASRNLKVSRKTIAKYVQTGEIDRKGRRFLAFENGVDDEK